MKTVHQIYRLKATGQHYIMFGTAVNLSDTSGQVGYMILYPAHIHEGVVTVEWYVPYIAESHGFFEKYESVDGHIVLDVRTSKYELKGSADE